MLEKVVALSDEKDLEELIQGDLSYTPAKKDRDWMVRFLMIAPTVWLTSYAMYKIDRDAKVVYLIGIIPEDPITMSVLSNGMCISKGIVDSIARVARDYHVIRASGWRMSFDRLGEEV